MRWTLIALGLIAASPAAAQEVVPGDGAICADRPGLASSTCTVAPGRIQVELAVDWSFQDDGDARTDTILSGDTVVRVGLDNRTEVQVGWTAFGHVRDRVRTPAGTAVDRASGTGDAFVGLRRGLYERGSFTVAAQGRVSLPVGGRAIGAGDWGAELIIPLGLERERFELYLTPAIAAATDADGDGRHAAYGLTAGGSYFLTDRLSAVLDLAIRRDEDPLGHTTETLLGLALSYEIDRDFQIDAGAVIGLNRDSPDLELYAGVARRF